MTRYILCIVVVCMMSSCGPADNGEASTTPVEGNKVMATKYNLQGVVSAYTENAMSDSYDDGDFIIFDRCTITIHQPPEGVPSELSVYREQVDDAEPSVLQNIGEKIQFSIEKESLGEGVTIFEGTLENVEAMKAEAH